MINNICENSKNNKSIQQQTAAATTTNAHKRHNDNDEDNNIVSEAQQQRRPGMGMGVGVGGDVVQTTYGNGIWYSEIIDSASNTNNKNNNNNPMLHKQQYYNNANNNNNENVVNRNVWATTAMTTTRTNDVLREQQQQQPKQPSNNECDIIIVDIEDEDNYDVDERERYQPPATYNAASKFSMNANLKYSKKPSTIIDNTPVPIPFLAKTNKIGNVNSITGHRTNDRDHVRTNNDNNVDGIEELLDDEEDDDAEDDDGDEEDSLDSMETLSDNVSIWIDGEKHWVAGVDANTTCSDLIWALLNYQNAQQHHSQPQMQQNQENIATTVINATHNNRKDTRQHLQQQQLPNVCDKTKNIDFSLSTKKDSCNIPNISSNNNTPFTTTPSSSSNANPTTKYSSPLTTSINQSMPINTKENSKIIPNTEPSSSTFISSSAPVPATPLPLTLPPGISTVSQLATEYVIVKQYHHCEEYLDGSTKVFDVLPPRDGSHKKQVSE